MQSHMEILQDRVAAADRENKTAVQEEARLRNETKTVKAAMDALTGRYEIVCRALAEGTTAEDPAALLAERDRHGHRLRGLEQLHQQAIAAAQRTAAVLVEATTALQAQQDVEELNRLTAAIVDAEKKQSEALAVLKEAETALATVKWMKRNFMRQMELKARGRA